MTSVCLACDGDICLKIRIKPLNIYLGVELIKTNNHIRAIVIFIVLKRCMKDVDIECCLQLAHNFRDEEKPGPSLLSQGWLPWLPGTGKKIGQ